LIWYVNYAYEDNNTKSHPGYGNVLPIDARPTPVKFPGGAMLGNRRQPFDATFGREKTDPVTFHRNGVAADVPSSPAIPLFDDSNPEAYWAAENPQNSCKVAGEGVKIKVVSGTTSALTVKIWFA
jgi:immune inhibitor A